MYVRNVLCQCRAVHCSAFYKAIVLWVVRRRVFWKCSLRRSSPETGLFVKRVQDFSHSYPSVFCPPVYLYSLVNAWHPPALSSPQMKNLKLETTVDTSRHFLINSDNVYYIGSLTLYLYIKAFSLIKWRIWCLSPIQCPGDILVTRYSMQWNELIGHSDKTVRHILSLRGSDFQWPFWR